MHTASGRLRPPVILVTFIVAALIFGVAAVLIAAPASPPPPAAPPSSGGVTLNDVFVFALVLLFILVTIPIVYFVLHRPENSSAVLQSRVVAVALTVILLMTAFVFLSHYVGGGGPTQLVPVPPGNNSTGGNPPPGNGNSNNSTLGHYVLWGFSIPPWVVYLVVVGIGVVAAVVLIPYLLISRRPITGKPSERSELREGLAQAITELSEATGGTPRERVIRVYARWLGRVTRGAGDLSLLTAREIERTCTDRLGIRRDTAHELTVLFEEARYSTHPMGEDGVTRAQQALTAALTEMDRLRATPVEAVG